MPLMARRLFYTVQKFNHFKRIGSVPGFVVRIRAEPMRNQSGKVLHGFVNGISRPKYYTYFSVFLVTIWEGWKNLFQM